MRANKNSLIYRLHDSKLVLFAKNYFQGKLIDIGCGTKPYKSMLSGFVTEHIGVDHYDTQHTKDNIDLFGTAYNIPAGNDLFDSALCTAVLEHLEEPEAALRECYRVLKPGGYAIYSMPFIWHLHEEPRDFYRYSKYGLEYLFKKTGFSIVAIEPLSGFWVTFGVLLLYNLERFNRGPLRWFYLYDLFCYVVQLMANLLNRIDRSTNWTWMYMVVAQKPEESR